MTARVSQTYVSQTDDPLAATYLRNRWSSEHRVTDGDTIRPACVHTFVHLRLFGCLFVRCMDGRIGCRLEVRHLSPLLTWISCVRLAVAPKRKWRHIAVIDVFSPCQYHCHDVIGEVAGTRAAAGIDWSKLVTTRQLKKISRLVAIARSRCVLQRWHTLHQWW